jgi:hypothetical protein
VLPHLIILGAVIVIGVASHPPRRRRRATPLKLPYDNRIYVRVAAQLRRAAHLMGVSPVPPLNVRRVPNAAASNSEVSYNDSWLRNQLARHCDDVACQDALLLGLMAHELAHYTLRHASFPHRHAHEKELEADAFAGVVLARAFVSTEQFESVLGDFVREATPTHPAFWLRLQRVRTAYALERNLLW